MNALVNNHISGQVPGEEVHILINPYDYAYEEVTASSLLKINFDGKLVLDSGTGYGVNLAGFVITENQSDAARVTFHENPRFSCYVAPTQRCAPTSGPGSGRIGK